MDICTHAGGLLGGGSPDKLRDRAFWLAAYKGKKAAKWRDLGLIVDTQNKGVRRGLEGPFGLLGKGKPQLGKVLAIP